MAERKWGRSANKSTVAEPREPRERLESSRRRIADPLVRERQPASSSSYHIQSPEHAEHELNPSNQTATYDSHQLEPGEPTTSERAPRTTRRRRSNRNDVSKSLATAQAVAQRVIDRAVRAQVEPSPAMRAIDAIDPDPPEPDPPQTWTRRRAETAMPDSQRQLRTPRARTETLTGLGSKSKRTKKRKDHDKR